MGIERVFLGWDEPILPRAAQWLLSQAASGSRLDLESYLCVLPGRRAGRRLVALLAEFAEQRRLWLVPPHVVTVGRLPEKLYPLKRPLANRAARQLAWATVLQRASEEIQLAITPRPPAPDDTEGWLAVARLCLSQHDELVAADLDFAEVTRRVAASLPPQEQRRWRALAELQTEYLSLLDEVGWWDVQQARRYALHHKECRWDGHVVLIGTADLNPITRLLLRQLKTPVTALVGAPESCRTGIDEAGCLVADYWHERPIEVAREQVEVVGGPEEQAEAAVRFVASAQSQYDQHQWTVGVGDDELVPYVRQAFGDHHVATRWGPGEPMATTEVFQTLRALERYLSHGTWADFRALVAMPAIRAHMERQMPGVDWLSAADEYAARHLPYRRPTQWRRDGDVSQVLVSVTAVVDQLAAPFHDTAQPWPVWGERCCQFLAQVYGDRQWDRDDPADRPFVVALEQLRDVVAEMEAVPPTLQLAVDGSTGIGLLLEQLVARRVAPPEESAIEMMGWLDVAMDDAPAVVVVGVQEGRVPSVQRSHLVLPNAARSQLGLPDSRQRYARDAYAMQGLVASRQAIKFVAGRRAADGTPQIPSRLLFAVEGDEAARRAKAWFAPVGETPVDGAVTRETDEDTSELALLVPRPQPLAEPITRLNVTAFRDYLACPYRFYLRHVLKLRPVAASTDEMDGALFGELAHEVLCRFGQSDARDASDEAKIRKVLEEILDACVAERFAGDAYPAVYVQVEQLRLRLRVFAERQAERVRQGWHIDRVEWVGGSEGAGRWDVDGQPFELSGRIDRIDIHEETGRWCVLDYKTSDRQNTPEKTHFEKGKWVDLQLPLYRHLLPGDAPELRAVTLGYICLPRDPKGAGFYEAKWTEEQLAEADDVARDVIRRIRREEFWPPVSPPPKFSEPWAAICQDSRMSAP